MTAKKLDPCVQPLLYNARAAGAALCCGEDMVRRLWDSGQLAYLDFEGERRSSHAQIVAYVEELGKAKRRLRAVKH